LIVLDASAAIARVLPSQKTSAAVDFFALAPQRFIAPRIFHWEFPNTLLRFERKGALTLEETDGAIAAWFSILDIRDTLSPLSLISLARTERLSPFDAAYLHLATQVGASIASRDQALLEAAHRRGVPVHDLR
jgi:predicted nucleic acid-binding protein